MENAFWKKYFFELMDVLVKWQRNENREPLDLLTIEVWKNHENTSSAYYNELMLIGVIKDSESDIRSAMESRHPSDVEFFEEMNDWFELGNPFGKSLSYYQKCGPIEKNLNLSTVIKELKNECEERYPGARIDFVGFETATSSSEGCYIATAVYGSYDCPEVWTLRRFRDEKLRKNAAGRLFVKAYYAVSPTVVRMFGEMEWFNRFWRGRLDAMVRRLNDQGYDDNPYYDR